ncbi:MAG: hypothetical protein HC848_10010 [Limnobacter sp.]|nr:hypothetical protein [Limnobacter sp.]
MKKTLLIASLLAVSLAACSKKEEVNMEAPAPAMETAPATTEPAPMDQAPATTEPSTMEQAPADTGMSTEHSTTMDGSAHTEEKKEGQ